MTHISNAFVHTDKSDEVLELERRCFKAYEQFGIAEVIWLVTQRCNFKCLHCHVEAGEQGEAELTTEESLELISELSEMGVPIVFISGGESLMRQDIHRILKEFKNCDIKVVLSCNGALLNEQNRKSLKENGVWFVAVSIHGPRDIHDNMVGVKGMFDLIVKNIEDCRKEGISLCVKSIVTEQNYQHIPWIIDYCCTEHNIRAFYICDMVSVGRAKGLKPLDQLRWGKLLDTLIDKITEHRIHTMDIGALPSAVSYLLMKLENGEVQGDFRAFRESLEKARACPTGKGFISISPEGDVLPCNFMSGYVLGNIRESKLKDIIVSSSKLVELSKSSPKGYCSSCAYKNLCSGCRAKAFINGDPLGEDPTCLLKPPF